MRTFREKTYPFVLLLWGAVLICLGLMFLQQRGLLVTFRQTLSVPREIIRAGNRSGEYVYKVALADLGLLPGEARLAGLTLLEDNVPLARPDSARRNTAQKGEGRYLVWGEILQFSSSDNTSPLKNGRVYSARLPLHISLRWLACAGCVFLLLTLTMVKYYPPFRGLLGILLLNLVLIGLLFYAFEAFLARREPRQTDGSGEKYPYDSNYAQINPAYYRDTDLTYTQKTREYTWGVLVEKNRLGFREREVSTPKPAGVCRIMVLGDSLTWGVGLETKERYTNLLEAHLKAAFPDRSIEVLNFSVRGYPTIRERDTLRTYAPAVDPDWVMVGYCKNDTQPRSEDYRKEKEVFDQRVMPYLSPVFQVLEKGGFPHISRTTQSALDRFLAVTGIVPGADVGLQRTYEKDSPEWQVFTAALKDIYDISRERGLSPPLFAVLNQSVESRGDGNYLDDSPDLPQPLRQTRQAERAAAEIGFLHTNMEKDILEKVKPEDMPLNPLDAHPSALAQRVYAEKLFAIVAEQIRSGAICAP